MRKIIVNADDYGMVKPINDGIIEAYNNGVLSSTTVMANLCEVDELIRLPKEAVGIGIGVHLNLTQGLPLTKFSTVREDGTFNRAKIFTGEYNLDEVKEEFIAQMEFIRSHGIILSHIDSHHHIHLQDKMRPLIVELASTYNLPVRGMCDKVKLIQSFYNKTVSLEYFLSLIENSSGTIEIMTHPAYTNDLLRGSTSYNDPRYLELQILTSEVLKDYYRKHQLIKANYLDI